MSDAATWEKRFAVRCAGAVLAAVLSAAPGLACDEAQTWPERTLCQYEDLVQLDRRLSGQFADLVRELALADRERLRGEQWAWLARRDECRKAGQPVGCLAAAYRSRIVELERREARADAMRRPPAPAEIEPTVHAARVIDRRLPQLRKRTAEEAGGVAFLWSDGGLPVMLVEPAAETSAGTDMWTRYYFRQGALFYAEGPADRAGFEGGEMVFWVNPAGKPANTAAAAWSARQQQLLSRSAGLLARFR